MYDEEHITHDAAHARFDGGADGVTVDGDDVSFDWDEVEQVELEDPPHRDAFDSTAFYKIPATVARPIPQPYQFGEDTVWLQKPRDELKDAAWSLDNAPWTLGHPETGMVKNVDDVRGFWSNPRYIDGQDNLDADLLVPVGDDEATEYIEENGDVSVGFYNRIARTDEYDGAVGGTDDGSIDVEGYQTNMLFDHCASVSVGRCPSSEGCGVDISVDGAEPSVHGHVRSAPESFKKGTSIMHVSDEAGGTTSVMAKSTDAPSGIYVVDGDWFAVSPDEHTDENTDWPDDAKFPVRNCTEVEDAWRLSGTGDISIEESTLEDRIERASDAMECDIELDAVVDTVDAAAAAKRYSVCGARKDVMQSNDCDTCGNTEETETDTIMDIDFDDLSAEAALAKVSAQNDGVSERLDDLREAEETAAVAEETAEELDIEDTADLADTAAVMKEQKEKLEERVDELQKPQMEEDASYIAEHTDRFGEDAEEVIENLDSDAEAVADKRDLVEDLTEQYDETTANGGGDDETSTGSTSKYAKTPW